MVLGSGAGGDSVVADEVDRGREDLFWCAVFCDVDLALYCGWLADIFVADFHHIAARFQGPDWIVEKEDGEGI